MALPSENASNTKSRNMKLVMVGLTVLVLVGVASIYAMSVSPGLDTIATQQPTDEQVGESGSTKMEKTEQHTELFVKAKRTLEYTEIFLETQLQSCNDLNSGWRESVTKFQKSEITYEEFLENILELNSRAQQYTDDMEPDAEVWLQMMQESYDAIYLSDTKGSFGIQEGVFSDSEEDILTEYTDAQEYMIADLGICARTMAKYDDIATGIINENEQKHTLGSIDVGENTQQPAGCNLYCDRTGHEPAWVMEGMRQYGALDVCINLMSARAYGSPNWNWCNEFSAYVMENPDTSMGTDPPPGKTGCYLFCDHEGYEPAWVTEGMGQGRARGICTNERNIDWYGNRDLSWCGELYKYMTDGLDAPAGTDTPPAKTICNLFCDHTGHEPAWVTEDMEQGRALDMCKYTIGAVSHGATDWSWCNEVFGYLIDGLDAPAGTGTQPAETDTPQAGTECSLLCDRTGYEPAWVTDGMGQGRAFGICKSVMWIDLHESLDKRWCNEFSGHLMDGLNAPVRTYAPPSKMDTPPAGTECSLLCDRTGYEPAWVTDGMEQNRALDICTHTISAVSDGIKDWNWCNRFSGYLMDGLNASAGTAMPPAETDTPQAGTECNLLCDRNGYEPAWVTDGMEHSTTFIICTNTINTGARGSPDWSWCNEFFGYVRDSLR